MKNYTKYFSFAILCLCTVSCRFISDKVRETDGLPEVRAAQAYTIIREDRKIYTYTAVARPVEVRRFTAPFECTVESIDIPEGGMAVKGQVLARLYSPALSTRVREATANLARLESELGKAIAGTGKDRGRNWTGSPEDGSGIEEINKKIGQAREELSKARKMQSACTIRAPFDGVVSKVEASPGASLATGEELITVIDPSRTELVAYIEPDALPERGQVLLFKGKDIEVSATMERCASKPNRMNGCFECVFTPEMDGKAAIAAGTELKFKLSGGSREMVSVPSTALQTDGATSYVWIIQNDSTVIRQPVVIQERPKDELDGLDAKRTLVISGLEGNEILVTAGFDGLQDQTKVQIK